MAPPGGISSTPSSRRRGNKKGVPTRDKLSKAIALVQSSSSKLKKASSPSSKLKSKAPAKLDLTHLAEASKGEHANRAPTQKVQQGSPTATVTAHSRGEGAKTLGNDFANNLYRAINQENEPSPRHRSGSASGSGHSRPLTPRAAAAAAARKMREQQQQTNNSNRSRAESPQGVHTTPPNNGAPLTPRAAAAAAISAEKRKTRVRREKLEKLGTTGHPPSPSANTSGGSPRHRAFNRKSAEEALAAVNAERSGSGPSGGAGGKRVNPAGRYHRDLNYKSHQEDVDAAMKFSSDIEKDIQATSQTLAQISEFIDTVSQSKAKSKKEPTQTTRNKSNSFVQVHNNNNSNNADDGTVDSCMAIAEVEESREPESTRGSTREEDTNARRDRSSSDCDHVQQGWGEEQRGGGGGGIQSTRRSHLEDKSEYDSVETYPSKPGSSLFPDPAMPQNPNTTAVYAVNVVNVRTHMEEAPMLMKKETPKSVRKEPPQQKATSNREPPATKKESTKPTKPAGFDALLNVAAATLSGDNYKGNYPQQEKTIHISSDNSSSTQDIPIQFGPQPSPPKQQRPRDAQSDASRNSGQSEDPPDIALQPQAMGSQDELQPKDGGNFSFDSLDSSQQVLGGVDDGLKSQQDPNFLSQISAFIDKVEQKHNQNENMKKSAKPVPTFKDPMTEAFDSSTFAKDFDDETLANIFDEPLTPRRRPKEEGGKKKEDQVQQVQKQKIQVAEQREVHALIEKAKSSGGFSENRESTWLEMEQLLNTISEQKGPSRAQNNAKLHSVESSAQHQSGQLSHTGEPKAPSVAKEAHADRPGNEIDVTQPPSKESDPICLVRGDLAAEAQPNEPSSVEPRSKAHLLIDTKPKRRQQLEPGSNTAPSSNNAFGLTIITSSPSQAEIRRGADPPTNDEAVARPRTDPPAEIVPPLGDGSQTESTPRNRSSAKKASQEIVQPSETSQSNATPRKRTTQMEPSPRNSDDIPVVDIPKYINAKPQSGQSKPEIIEEMHVVDVPKSFNAKPRGSPPKPEATFAVHVVDIPKPCDAKPPSGQPKEEASDETQVVDAPKSFNAKPRSGLLKPEAITPKAKPTTPLQVEAREPGTKATPINVECRTPLNGKPEPPHFVDLTAVCSDDMFKDKDEKETFLHDNDLSTKSPKPCHGPQNKASNQWQDAELDFSVQDNALKELMSMAESPTKKSGSKVPSHAFEHVLSDDSEDVVRLLDNSKDASQGFEHVLSADSEDVATLPDTSSIIVEPLPGSASQQGTPSNNENSSYVSTAAADKDGDSHEIVWSSHVVAKDNQCSMSVGAADEAGDPEENLLSSQAVTSSDEYSEKTEAIAKEDSSNGSAGEASINSKRAAVGPSELGPADSGSESEANDNQTDQEDFLALVGSRMSQIVSEDDRDPIQSLLFARNNNAPELACERKEAGLSLIQLTLDEVKNFVDSNLFENGGVSKQRIKELERLDQRVPSLLTDLVDDTIQDHIGSISIDPEKSQVLPSLHIFGDTQDEDSCDDEQGMTVTYDFQPASEQLSDTRAADDKKRHRDIKKKIGKKGLKRKFSLEDTMAGSGPTNWLASLDNIFSCKHDGKGNKKGESSIISEARSGEVYQDFASDHSSFYPSSFDPSSFDPASKSTPPKKALTREEDRDQGFEVAEDNIVAPNDPSHASPSGSQEAQDQRVISTKSTEPETDTQTTMGTTVAYFSSECQRIAPVAHAKAGTDPVAATAAKEQAVTMETIQKEAKPLPLSLEVAESINLSDASRAPTATSPALASPPSWNSKRSTPSIEEANDSEDDDTKLFEMAAAMVPASSSLRSSEENKYIKPNPDFAVALKDDKSEVCSFGVSAPATVGHEDDVEQQANNSIEIEKNSDASGQQSPTADRASIEAVSPRPLDNEVVDGAQTEFMRQASSMLGPPVSPTSSEQWSAPVDFAMSQTSDARGPQPQFDALDSQQQRLPKLPNMESSQKAPDRLKFVSQSDSLQPDFQAKSQPFEPCSSSEPSASGPSRLQPKLTSVDSLGQPNAEVGQQPPDPRALKVASRSFHSDFHTKSQASEPTGPQLAVPSRDSQQAPSSITPPMAHDDLFDFASQSESLPDTEGPNDDDTVHSKTQAVSPRSPPVVTAQQHAIDATPKVGVEEDAQVKSLGVNSTSAAGIDIHEDDESLGESLPDRYQAQAPTCVEEELAERKSPKVDNSPANGTDVWEDDESLVEQLPDKYQAYTPTDSEHNDECDRIIEDLESLTTTPQHCESPTFNSEHNECDRIIEDLESLSGIGMKDTRPPQRCESPTVQKIEEQQQSLSPNEKAKPVSGWENFVDLTHLEEEETEEERENDIKEQNDNAWEISLDLGSLPDESISNNASWEKPQENEIETQQVDVKTIEKLDEADEGCLSPRELTPKMHHNKEFDFIEDVDEDDNIDAYFSRMKSLKIGGHLPNLDINALGSYGDKGVDSETDNVEVDLDVGFVKKALAPIMSEDEDDDEDQGGSFNRYISLEESLDEEEHHQAPLDRPRLETISDEDNEDEDEDEDESSFVPSSSSYADRPLSDEESCGSTANNPIVVVSSSMTDAANEPAAIEGGDAHADLVPDFSAYHHSVSYESDNDEWLRKRDLATRKTQNPKSWLTRTTSGIQSKLSFVTVETPKVINGVAAAKKLGSRQPKLRGGRRRNPIPSSKSWKLSYKERTKEHVGYFDVDFFSLFDSSAVGALQPHHLDPAPWESRDARQHFLHDHSISFSKNWFGKAQRTRGNDRIRERVAHPKSMEMPMENKPHPEEWTEEWYTTWKAPDSNSDNSRSVSSSSESRSGGTDRDGTEESDTGTAQDESSSYVEEDSSRFGGSSYSSAQSDGDFTEMYDYYEDTPQCGTLINVKPKIGERVSRIHPDYTSQLRRSRWRKKYFPRGTFPYDK